MAAGRVLRLGGVEIPHDRGLVGHSDADALIHALIDALLGAAALGDIGSHFPDTDEKWRGADSAKLLAMVMDELKLAGWRVNNVDCTVICEKPKLRPYIADIRSRLSMLLECDQGAISVKGKTNEGLDAIGAGQGLAVHAVASIVR